MVEVWGTVYYEPANEYEQFAKDMFLFSYYGRGINFIDVLKLEKNGIYNDTVSYLRTKTGVAVRFKLTEISKEIIKRYQSEPDSKLIFRILKDNNTEVAYVKKQVCHKPFLKHPLLLKNCVLIVEFIVMENTLII